MFKNILDRLRGPRHTVRISVPNTIPATAWHTRDGMRALEDQCQFLGLQLLGALKSLDLAVSSPVSSAEDSRVKAWTTSRFPEELTPRVVSAIENKVKASGLTVTVTRDRGRDKKA